MAWPEMLPPGVDVRWGWSDPALVVARWMLLGAEPRREAGSADVWRVEHPREGRLLLVDMAVMDRARVIWAGVRAVVRPAV